MIFPIDRLQFLPNGDLIAFEFLNKTKELKNSNFISRKVELLNKSNFVNHIYNVSYSSDSPNFLKVVSVIPDIRNPVLESRYVNYVDFCKWFNQINSSNTSLSSKGLGTATTNVGDPFVQSLLTSIFRDTEFSQTVFSDDDSGIGLVKNTLNGTFTYGFDFDLFEETNHIIIEFLKRENSFVTNLTAHPSRYPKNKQKFISLWKAANKIYNGNSILLFVNYSDSVDESITVLEIKDFDTNVQSDKMVLSDIGYKFEGQNQFRLWLKIMNTNAELALTQLRQLPKQVRNESWWNKFYNDNTHKKYKRILGLIYR